MTDDPIDRRSCPPPEERVSDELDEVDAAGGDAGVGPDLLPRGEDDDVAGAAVDVDRVAAAPVDVAADEGDIDLVYRPDVLEAVRRP